MNHITAVHRKTIWLLGLGLIVCILASFTLGHYPVPLNELLGILGSRLGLPIEPFWTEQMETAVAIHFRLTDAWETLDGFILLLSNLGFLGLLLLKQMGKCNLSLGRRVAYMGALAEGTMLPGLVFSLFDPVYAFINYGITPLFLWARMLLFFIIDLAVDRFRKRKKAA